MNRYVTCPKLWRNGENVTDQKCNTLLLSVEYTLMNIIVSPFMMTCTSLCYSKYPEGTRLRVKQTTTLVVIFCSFTFRQVWFTKRCQWDVREMSGMLEMSGRPSAHRYFFIFAYLFSFVGYPSLSLWNKTDQFDFKFSHKFKNSSENDFFESCVLHRALDLSVSVV